LLITKEVEIGLIGVDINHYEKLNYKIPRIRNKRGDLVIPRNTKILIKVKDLQNGSHVKVDIKCDECGNELKNIIWKDYIKSIKEDGTYYCRKCASKLYGQEKIIKTKLENGKSFEQWCLENNRNDVLNRWDYELNDCDPKNILYCTKEKYYFKCPRGIHESELKNIGNFTSGQEGSIRCNSCNSFAQLGIDNLGEKFLEKYWDYNKNTVDPWKISYSCDKKVWIKCQEKDYHESYDIRCPDFIKGDRCGYCNGNKVHPLDSLGKLLKDNSQLNTWSDKNEKSPYEFKPNSSEKSYWKCPEGKHEDYYKSIKESKDSNFRCPECTQKINESILQEKVRKYISNIYNLTLLHEHKCTIIPKNPKTKMPLPFDNEIEELKLIIEVHGKQHYEINGFHILQAKHNNTTPEYELHYQKVKDRYKRMFAKSKINNYKYLEIPYYTDDKNETWKKLIDDKINEICGINKAVNEKYIEDKYIEQQNKSA